MEGFSVITGLHYQSVKAGHSWDVEPSESQGRASGLASFRAVSDSGLRKYDYVA